MTIYVTGDIHGTNSIRRLNSDNFWQQEDLTKEDYVIIAGDFGLLWNMDKEDKYWLKWLDEKPFTTLFVDGNHENFDLLYSYSQEDWKGGKIRRINDSVFHLGRGEIFEIEGNSIFTFGGARSIDKIHRKEGVSWWSQELPSKEEIEYAIDNLEKVKFKVDYVITHTTSQNTMREEFYFKEDELINNFFNFLEEELGFKKWYFGHFHEDKTIWDNKRISLYEKIVKLGDVV